MCGRLPAVKGLITSQRWSEQPCVRPISAAHRAAGHNALRGSGPGQKLAFNDALAHVGCPDHRPSEHVSDMTGSALRAVGPFQPSHRACRRDLLLVVASPLPRERDGFPVTLALGHHRPGHAGDLVGQCYRGDFRRSALEQPGKPRAMLGAMDFGVADDR